METVVWVLLAVVFVAVVGLWLKDRAEKNKEIRARAAKEIQDRKDRESEMLKKLLELNEETKETHRRERVIGTRRTYQNAYSERSGANDSDATDIVMAGMVASSLMSDSNSSSSCDNGSGSYSSDIGGGYSGGCDSGSSYSGGGDSGGGGGFGD